MSRDVIVVTDAQGFVLDRINQELSPFTGMRGRAGGARSRMLDRLEHAGWVRRSRVTRDRMLTGIGSDALKVYKDRQARRLAKLTST